MAIFDNFDWGSALSNAFGLGAPEGSPVGGGPPLNVQPPPPQSSNDVVPQDFSQIPPQQELPSPGLPAPGTPLPPPRPPQAPTLASAVAPVPPPAAAPLPPPVPVNRPPGPQAGVPPGAQLFPPGPPPGGPTAQMPPGAVPPPGGAPPGQPYPNVGPFLSNLFGPNPRLAQQIGGSLGEGLKSVGQNWNKPGLAAFAGSAGAAISGGTKADKEYFGELAQAVKINDAKNTADSRTELMRQKLIAAQKTGTISGRQAAWQTSDIGRFNLAETRVQAAVEGKRKELKTDLESPIPEEREKAQKQLDTFREQKKNEIYRGFGLDPKKNYENMGQPVYKPDGKIDVDATSKQAHRPRTWDEFQATVKPGDYYVDPKTGKTLQRTSEVPPPSDHPASPLAQIPDYPAEGTAEEAAA